MSAQVIYPRWSPVLALVADDACVCPGGAEQMGRAVLEFGVLGPVQVVFLGREQDLAVLGSLLGEGRLVTLTGAGGVGKTRLAVEVGAQVLERFPQGVWLADLAGVTSGGLVTVQVMEALGVRQAGDVPVMEALHYRLRSAELLLVIDNCEHLLDACAELAGALLRGSPGLRVLATSREPLGVPGEVTYLVRPLALAPESADAADTARSPAVRLFLNRGSAARGSTTTEVAPVTVAGRICRTLDGLPLAIELAAARMGTLSAAEIEVHLADRFRFLAYRRPVADPRHQALRAIGERGYRSSVTCLLAEALYARGRLDEAERRTEEAEALAAADDIDAQARWRVTRAKLPARRGEFSAARPAGRSP
jgi:predicted ATPase